MRFDYLRKAHTAARDVWLRHRLSSFGQDAHVDRSVRFDYPGGISVGDRTSIGHGAVIRANTPDPLGVRIGSDVSIKDYAVINANQGSVHIGDRAWIGPHCLIYGNGGVKIGANVLVAGHTTINTVSHVADRTDVPINDQGIYCDPVVIEEDVWIGLNCTILQGVTIGSGAIIGAGAVVTNDVPPGSIAFGIPARVVRHRDIARNQITRTVTLEAAS